MAKNKKPGSQPLSYTQRRKNNREPLPRFLIVCEGEKTEPNYFRSFHLPSATVEVVGTGYNTVSLVEKARELKRKGRYRVNDQVWCVFDRDSFPVQHFNEAINSAEREGIRVAYSNEAFELWYLLHYIFLDTAISRTNYIEKLEGQMGRKYKKNSREMYSLLESRLETAIRNAATLLAKHDPTSSPVECNPSTTVHLLVAELRRYSR